MYYSYILIKTKGVFYYYFFSTENFRKWKGPNKRSPPPPPRPPKPCIPAYISFMNWPANYISYNTFSMQMYCDFFFNLLWLSTFFLSLDIHENDNSVLRHINILVILIYRFEELPSHHVTTFCWVYNKSYLICHTRRSNTRLKMVLYFVLLT